MCQYVESLALTQLKTSDLIEALQSVERAFDGALPGQSAERARKEIQTSSGVVTSEDPATVELHAIFANYSRHILTDAAYAQLRRTNIFCLDQPICNAQARKTQEGTPFALIYTGLLSVATFRLGLAILIHNVQLMQRCKGENTVANEATLKALSFNAVALSYWFYLDGEPNPLPGFCDLFCEEHRLQMIHGVGGAISFVVMHEVGHIELGHLTAKSHPLPQMHGPMDFEELNAAKTMELEADRFAASCFKPEIRLGIVTGLSAVMDIFADMDGMCLIPRESSHPFIVNRIQALMAAVKLEDDPFFMTRASTILNQRKSLLSERAKQFPIEAKFFSEAMNKVKAVAAFKSTLPSKNDCLDSLEKLQSMYDGLDYIEVPVDG